MRGWRGGGKDGKRWEEKRDVTVDQTLVLLSASDVAGFDLKTGMMLV